MGRKKRRAGADEQISCYYCLREFSGSQALHQLVTHQKEFHMKCNTCNKRCSGISSLSSHSQQVHNITLTSVPNAVKGRTDPSVDVFGMQGIPDEETSASKRHRPRLSASPVGQDPPELANGFGAQGSVPPVMYFQYQQQPHLHHMSPQHLYPQSYQPGTMGTYQSPFVQTQPVPGQFGMYEQQFGNQLLFSRQPYSFGTTSGPPYSVCTAQPQTATPAWVPRSSQRPDQNFPIQKPDAVAPPHVVPPRIIVRTSASSAAATSQSLPAEVPSNRPMTMASALSSKLSDEFSATTTAPVAAAQTTPSAVLSVPAKKQDAKKSVVVVFDRDDVCMEELRAQLPQYKGRLSRGTS
jgi:hypothetical protein